MSVPAFLFAYANDRGNDQRYLRNLPEERRAIKLALRTAADAKQLAVVECTNATIDEVLEECQRYSGRLTMFHFAGHADGEALVFERRDGSSTMAAASSIAGFLGGLGSLRLVVLNGCSTQAQVEMLLARGIPAVVATSARIRDDVATSFAHYFYSAIGHGETIAASFQQASSAVMVKFTADEPAGQDRGLSALCRDVDVDGLAGSTLSLWSLHGDDTAKRYRLVSGSSAQPRPAQLAQANIFMSYHRRDDEAELANRLHQELSKQGHTVFIDIGMTIGRDWAFEIQRSIAESDVFIVLVSKESIAREMVQAEVREAYRRFRRHGKPQILPIRVRYDGPLDYEIECYIGRLHHASWNNRNDDSAVLDQIRSAITGTLLTTPAPPNDRTVAATLLPGGLPTPAMDPRFLAVPGGTMTIHDPLYVRRHGDDDTDALARAERGQTLIIKGPRQRGKSSLLVRYLAARRTRNIRVGLIDFQTFSGVDLESYPEFLVSLAVAILDVLEIDASEPKIRRQMDMNRFIQRTVLDVTGPLVLAFDEVDRVANRSYRTDFFSMLRSWHNNRAMSSSPAWQTLDLALVLSTEPDLLIQDGWQSPFNVGHTIELDCLTREQCHAMNAGCAPRQLSPEDVDELYGLLGGHPYLTRLAYHRVLTGALPMPLDFRLAGDPHGPFGDHLRAIVSRLAGRPALLSALQRIIRDRTAEPDLVHRLRSVGLIRTIGGIPSPANLLYTMFFRSIQ